MNPDLVCKIVVKRTGSEGKVRGTGYPIAANRIITAAHLVKDLADSDSIQLLFGESQEPISASESIDVVWNGFKSDPQIDVAILQCSLPSEYHPTDLTLLRTRSKSPTAWQSQGYSAIAKTRMANGLHDYAGPRFPMVTPKSSSKEITCDNGPQRKSNEAEAELWGGISGSSVFESSGLQRLLGIVTHYLTGDRLPSLRVVPIRTCSLNRGLKKRFALKPIPMLEWNTLRQFETPSLMNLTNSILQSPR